MPRIRVLSSLALMLAACGDGASDPGDLVSSPLPPRAATDGKRFQRLDPAQTGVDFVHLLRRENVIPYVYSGSGAAVGDYDQDGLPDLYLLSQDGPNQLYRQVAPLRFENVTQPAGGVDGGDAWGTAASFADVDGDGDLDLYVCNLESPNLLYVNQGDGTFCEQAAARKLDFCGASMGCAFADFDDDGDLDLYVLTNRLFGPNLPEEIAAEATLPKTVRRSRDEIFLEFRSQQRPRTALGYQDVPATVGGHPLTAGQPDRLFRNDGAAGWHDVTAEAGLQDAGNGLGVVWWDYDDDGRLDLYVANDIHSPDQLWHNEGNGRFRDVTVEALPHVAFFGMGCDFGDLDNDGRFDLVVADMSSTSHYMGKMLMGSMDVHRWFLMNSLPQQYMRNAVFLNTGTGRFLEAAHLTGLASTDWTWTVRFADLDDDGWLDLFATNGIPSFEDNPDLVMQFQKLWRGGDKQKALDIARNLPRVDEKKIARRNDGKLHFDDVGAEWGLDENSVGQGAVVVDLDRDGDLDIVVNNQNGPASLFENRSHDRYRALVDLRGRRNRFGIGARITLTAGGITQTRLVSPTRGYMAAGDTTEHFGLGNATRIERLTVRWPGGLEQSYRDLPADHRFTIHEGKGERAAPPVPPQPRFVADDRVPMRHRERDFDDYAVQPLLPHRLSRLGPGLALGDADGDGRDDLYMGGGAGQPGELMLQQQDGTWRAQPGPWIADAAAEDLGALWLDGDRDGDLDLYVVSGGIEAREHPELLQDRWYRNEGGGRFVRDRDALPAERLSGSCAAAGDVDGDGDLDLFVGTRTEPGRFPHAPGSLLLRNDGGRFTDATAELAPALRELGMVTGAVFADHDGDGRTDLTVAASWQPIRHLRNEGGKLVDRTAELGLAELRGQWNSIAAADLDGDGDLDYVAGNLGKNSKYKASAQRPLRLFGNDYDRNGQFDVVEAKTSGEQMLPVRGRSCSSQAMPFLADKFPTYDQFARATLAEIYTEPALRESIELVCNELQSTVFENRDGRLVARPLPFLAQIAPCDGIAIADFDQDGRLDLVLAQNSFSPEPETGRFDGGLGMWLRGLGGCQFEVVGTDRSGLSMPLDQQALVQLDLDGDQVPDLLCAQNDAPLRGWRTRAERKGLAVRLRGPAGNPTAVGARLELRSPDGTVQRRDVLAGGGYLSQSGGVQFFTPPPAGSTLKVRWPDGSTVETKLPQTQGILDLTP